MHKIYASAMLIALVSFGAASQAIAGSAGHPVSVGQVPEIAHNTAGAGSASENSAGVGAYTPVNVTNLTSGVSNSVPSGAGVQSSSFATANGINVQSNIDSTKNVDVSSSL